MTRSAFVSLVGRPNVGKSTLLNALVGERVAIVSPKPQTTRTRITGILTRGEDQFVFIDTPGMHRPRTKLGEFMAGEIRESMSDVDVAVLVSEPAGGIDPVEKELLARLSARKTPVLLALNKIDLLPRKEEMMEKMAAFASLCDFAEIVPVSALKGDGVPLLLEQLSRFAVEGPHFFDDDAYTEQPERVIAAELIREQLLRTLREEIPHGIAVVVETMSERAGADLVDIEAVIYCEKATHKGIIIGKQGETLKGIATRSRASLERFLQAKVHLRCWVKIRKDWRNRESSLKELGFR